MVAKNLMIDVLRHNTEQCVLVVVRSKGERVIERKSTQSNVGISRNTVGIRGEQTSSVNLLHIQDVVLDPCLRYTMECQVKTHHREIGIKLRCIGPFVLAAKHIPCSPDIRPLLRLISACELLAVQSYGYSVQTMDLVAKLLRL